jgi:hypothetical protein
LLWIAYFPGQLISCISDSFLACVFYILLISQVMRTRLDKKTFWQKMIDSFLPIFYLSLIFGTLNYLLTAGEHHPVYPWAPKLSTFSEVRFNPQLRHSILGLLDYFFLPFPIVVIIHKLGFKDAVLKLKSWHLKYPERIAGFLLSSWIILFCIFAASESLNYLLLLNGPALWNRIAIQELNKLITIPVSSWLLLCLIQLVKELHETDTGTGDEQDYFIENAQEPGQSAIS